jgi:hypothetical protein
VRAGLRLNPDLQPTQLAPFHPSTSTVTVGLVSERGSRTNNLVVKPRVALGDPVSDVGPPPDKDATGHDVRHHSDYAVGVGVEKATDFAGSRAAASPKSLSEVCAWLAVTWRRDAETFAARRPWVALKGQGS